MNFSSRERKIITILLEHEHLPSSGVYEALVELGEDASLVTVKRTLSGMAARGMVAASGSGRSVSYRLDTLGRVYADIDAKAYGAIEPDRRHGMTRYNQGLFARMPGDLFSQAELQKLEDATAEYRRQTTDAPPAIQKRELERLAVELSWKSSKIEGNTYTLLDTEKLILEHTEAPGHTRAEALMILNHKDAFDFARANTSFFRAPSRASIEELHAILVQGLDVDRGIRARAVGITGSVYLPLDNQHQIREAFDALVAAIARMETSYAKALLALLGTSYLQPFADGNKRTARLLANAILLAHACAPLSYRSVEETEYREALFVFYELNSIVPFKRIFIEQYDFAARTYAAK